MLSIYKASAGSGKTFALTREYIRMLLKDRQNTDFLQPHSRILAVTFTKKSTAEMKARILKELYILALTPNKSDYIKEYLDDKTMGLTKEEIQHIAQQRLVEILQDYNRFSVSTIDGFFQQVIRTFALDLDLSTNYDLALDYQEIIDQAVDDIFRRIRDVNTKEKELVEWLIEYAQNNIQQNKNWNPIRNVKTFANELSKERLIKEMDKLQDIFAEKETMRNYQKSLENLAQEAVNAVKEQVELIKKALATFNEDELNTRCIGIVNKQPEEIIKSGLNDSLLKVLMQEATLYKKTGKSAKEQEELKNRCNSLLMPLFEQLQKLVDGEVAYKYITANAILAKLYSLGILQDVASQIESTNRQQGRLPISDINQLIFQIIDGQEAPFIYERIGQYFHHYMIDEFQDTSELQWQNFKPLIEEAESHQHDNLIVGDVKQSIYRFRNSDWHLLNQLSGEFTKFKFGEGMGNNWRTAKPIVEQNEKLMHQYCEWIVNKLKTDYPNADTTPIDEIKKIYSITEMHQEAKKKYDGYFHMQFFDPKTYDEDALNALTKQIEGFQQENIDLSRVTILTRYSRESEQIAQHLIQCGYSVQSSEGLRIGSHIAVQIIVQLLKLSVTEEKAAKIYLRDSIEDFEQYADCIAKARKLALYDHVQALIDDLKLYERDGATPYLTAFQNLVFKFTQTKVADTELFLKYWEQKEKKATIPAPKTSEAITIMTIHSSKGLEFDIVIIPFFNWSLEETHHNDIIWCAPHNEPFNTLPLVPVHPSPTLLRSYLADDYIQEELAKYTDNLNLTYVAVTRPRYRLYLYGPMYTYKKKEIQINNVGNLFAHLVANQMDQNLIYALDHLPELPPKDPETIKTAETKYVSIPINNRLILNRQEKKSLESNDAFDMTQLGNMMHNWLANIRTWKDAQPALQRMLINADITQEQAQEMQEELNALKKLITTNHHDDWFSGQYQILTEQDIITSSGKVHRPDRVLIKDKHAIVVDYKFGYIESPTYTEQVRDYMLWLRALGYTSEGYIIYNQSQRIQVIQ